MNYEKWPSERPFWYYSPIIYLPYISIVRRTLQMLCCFPDGPFLMISCLSSLISCLSSRWPLIEFIRKNLFYFLLGALLHIIILIMLDHSKVTLKAYLTCFYSFSFYFSDFSDYTELEIHVNLIHPSISSPLFT